MGKTYPKVALVGRTNVGKSTLFNRLTKSKQSMVFSQEGVTRDYLRDTVSWNNKTFNLLDTGGLPVIKTTDLILKEVEQSVFDILKETEIILFVCDGKNGLTEQDRRLAKILHKTKKKVFLLLNKADNTRAFEEHEYEFYSLGFKEVFPISATHGTGVRELLDAITEEIEGPVETKDEEAAYNIVILGKPNVGKSSLINLLLQEKRSIVSEVAGTTREAISEKIAFHKDFITITDTPGVRKKSKVDDPLEVAMVKSALQAVRNADIVLVMIDSTEGHLADQELKLLFYAYEEKKSIILLFNKTDILEEEAKDRLKYDLLRYEFIIDKIQTIWISCKTKKNIGNVFKEIQKAHLRRLQTFDASEVNELIKDAITKRPMYHKRQLLKILHVKVRKGDNAVPTFVLYVNHPQWFGPTQLGFIENQLRKKYDLLGCPIKFIVQKV